MENNEKENLKLEDSKKKMLPKDEKLYQEMQESNQNISKEHVNDEDHEHLPPQEDEIEKGKDKDEAVKEIMSKCKFKQEYVDNNVILSVNHLKQYFFFGSGPSRYKLKAVHDISFQVHEGECFGLVGESGCGKTTTGRSIIRLYNITSGSIYYKGHRIGAGSRWNEKEIKFTKKRLKASEKDLALKLKNGEISKEEHDEALKAAKENAENIVKVQKAKIKQIKYDDTHVDPNLMREIQMIFQDPVDSLDPRMTVESIISEGLQIQGFKNKVENHQKVVEALERVGLIEDYANRYPHEFSGGQRQRIGIARALVMNPKFLICDEPISALDVSIRAQIINLLNDLKEEYKLSMLFIAHDLSVVKYFCDRIAVMYFGEIVELATSDELFKHPLHPYTKSLLSAIPKPNPLTEKNRKRIVYHPEECHDYSKEKPKLVEILPGHFILANTPEIEKYKEQIANLDKVAAEGGDVLKEVEKEGLEENN